MQYNISHYILEAVILESCLVMAAFKNFSRVSLEYLFFDKSTNQITCNFHVIKI